MNPTQRQWHEKFESLKEIGDAFEVEFNTDREATRLKGLIYGSLTHYNRRADKQLKLHIQIMFLSKLVKVTRDE